MDIFARSADEFPAIMAIAGCWPILITFVTLDISWILYLLQSVLDFHKVMDMESWLKVRHIRSWGKEGGLSAGGTKQRELFLSVLNHQSLEAVLAVDMEAIE